MIRGGTPRGVEASTAIDASIGQPASDVARLSGVMPDYPRCLGTSAQVGFVPMGRDRSHLCRPTYPRRSANRPAP
jgi:hypothetical protein